MSKGELDYIQAQLMRMIKLEREERPKWHNIASISDETMDYIHNHHLIDEIDYYIYKFLEDVDIRMKDAVYAEGQRKQVVRRLR